MTDYRASDIVMAGLIGLREDILAELQESYTDAEVLEMLGLKPRPHGRVVTVEKKRPKVVYPEGASWDLPWF